MTVPLPPDRGQETSPAGLPVGLVAAAESLFGVRLPLAARYAELLATAGVERGLLGPREAPRLWDRHLLNCAAVAELLPDGTRLADIGSGAGLPGIVLAIARPDCHVTLVEPLARRTAFLTEVSAALGMDNVDVQRARAEELHGRIAFPVVTCRAVAPMDRLAAWCLPLVTRGGHLLAIKGASAAAELSTHDAAIRRAGGQRVRVVRCGKSVLHDATTVVEVMAGSRPDQKRRMR